MTEIAVLPHPGLVAGAMYLDYNAIAAIDLRVVDATVLHLMQV